MGNVTPLLMISDTGLDGLEKLAGLIGTSISSSVSAAPASSSPAPARDMAAPK